MPPLRATMFQARRQLPAWHRGDGRCASGRHDRYGVHPPPVRQRPPHAPRTPPTATGCVVATMYGGGVDLASAAVAAAMAAERSATAAGMKAAMEAQRQRAEESLARSRAVVEGGGLGDRSVTTSPSRVARVDMVSPPAATRGPTTATHFPAPLPPRASGYLHNPTPTILPASGNVSVSLDELNASAASSAYNPLGITTTSISTNSRAVLAALRALQDKIRRVEGEKARAEAEAGRLRVEVAGLREAHDAAKRDTAAAHEALVDDLQRQLAQLRRELAAIRSSGDETRAHLVEAHRADVDRMQHTITTLRAERTELQTALTRREEDVKAHLKALEHERSRCAMLEERNAALSRAAEERVKAVTHDSMTRMATANAAAQAAEARAARLQVEAEHAHRLLESERSARHEAQASADALHDRLDSVATLNKALVDNIPGSPPKRRPGSAHSADSDGFAGDGGAGSAPTRGRTHAAVMAAATPGVGVNMMGGGLHTARRSVSSAARRTHSRSRSGGGSTGPSMRRGVHPQLRPVYGDGTVPFIPAGPAPTSHSVLANVQMSISQPAAYGNRSQLVAVEGVTNLTPRAPVVVSAGAGAVPEGDRYGGGPLAPGSPQWHGVTSTSAHHRHPHSTKLGSGGSGGGKAGGAIRVRAPSLDALMEPPAAHAVAGGGDARSAVTAGTGRRASIGMPVAAVPESALAVVLASLESEYEQLRAQYESLLPLAGSAEGATEGAAASLAAMQEKGRQIALLRDAEPGTIAGPVRSPVRNPDAAAKRVDALRTMHHLKALALEAGKVSDLDLISATPAARRLMATS